MSSGDSVDWKNPTSAEIMKKVLGKVQSGSIILFHNDLDNTTAALPEILKQLKADGYQLVGVEDLIYTDNYTIDANGRQHLISESLIDIDGQNIEQVMAQYSEQLTAAGISEEQIAAAAEAIRNGDIDSLPKELQPVAAQVAAKLEKAANSYSFSETSSESSFGDSTTDSTQQLK